MILDIKLYNDIALVELERVNIGITINYDITAEKGRTIVPSQVTIYGPEALKVYDLITSSKNNTVVEVKLTDDSGSRTILEGFTNMNSDVVFHYNQNLVSFSVTLYNKSVNLSYILNEKILNITNPSTYYKTFVISYSANQEIIVGLAVTGLAVCIIEVLDIIKDIGNISTVSANPLAYHEILKILPLIVKIVSVAPILYSVIDNIKTASRPNILEVDCFSLYNLLSQSLAPFNYSLVVSEKILQKIKSLCIIEPIQVNIDDLDRGLVKEVERSKVVPTTSILDILEFIKHYAGATVIVKDKTIYIEDKDLTTISTTNLKLDKINIDNITPKKEYNNLRVFNYAIDASNELSLSNKTSEKVFYSETLYNKYTSNLPSLSELDNGIYTYNSPFSITTTKDKKRKIEKVWDLFGKIFNKFINILNGAIKALNTVVSGIVGAINKIIKAINKLLKTKLKTIAPPPPIPTVKEIDLIENYLGFLQTETATFVNPIIFEGKIKAGTVNIIIPRETKKHLIENTDKRNFIYERLAVKFPIPINKVDSLKDYWTISFDNGFEEKKYLLESYSVNITEGNCIVEAQLTRLKETYSEIKIL